MDIFNFFGENYKWIFSGIGILIITSAITFFKKKKGKNTNGYFFNNTFNFQGKPKLNPQAPNSKKGKQSGILFIDDNHADFKMVSILKKAGYQNTKSTKDINDLDDYRIKESDIIFVDVNGVGTDLFDDQGIGLAAALKQKYSEKVIIVYSSETTGNRFNKKLRLVDDCLPKNAEPYEFISIIEEHSNR